MSQGLQCVRPLGLWKQPQLFRLFVLPPSHGDKCNLFVLFATRSVVCLFNSQRQHKRLNLSYDALASAAAVGHSRIFSCVRYNRTVSVSTVKEEFESIYGKKVRCFHDEANEHIAFSSGRASRLSTTALTKCFRSAVGVASPRMRAVLRCSITPVLSTCSIALGVNAESGHPRSHPSQSLVRTSELNIN
jgi:hypothetical protein